MPHPLDSARERLKRANENIGNLKREIDAFLAPFPRIVREGRYPVFTDSDSDAWDVLRKEALSRKTYPRFGLLTGEIVHHLRSTVDHIAWQLSSGNPKCEFPVSDSRDICKWKEAEKKFKPSRHCGKIQGISSPSALARIELLQPYIRADRDEHPLWLIHELDRLDKHRELPVVFMHVAVQISGSRFQTVRTVEDSATGGFRILGPTGPVEVKMYTEVSPQIAMGEFLKREREPLVPLLQQLTSFTSDAVESFAEEFA